VYNRHWPAGGGAEAYGAAVAALLARGGPVELWGHQDFDRDALAERLAIDLSGCAVRVLPPSSAAVTRASRDVDLLVNVSHRSREASAARRSLYVVHFPTTLGAVTPGAPITWGSGWHPPDGRVTWSDGAGQLVVTRPTSLTVLLGFSRPEPVEVTLLVDGEPAARTTLDRPRGPLERWSGRALTVRVPGPAVVTVASDAFVPGAGDARSLGVPVLAAVAGSGARERLLRRAVPPTDSLAWLDSYDRLVANSAYTRQWVQRLWHRDSTVLHPPVSLRRAGVKEPVILGVGRFMPQGHGHSKKQLELVEAFKRLVDGGLRGWTLHLVGGRTGPGVGYFEAVRQAAAGYPVELHPDATGAELDALYARASVFWHTAGLGEDEQRHPDRLEHFGISTVEAMSAGAVPVVVRLGGLVETVRDGVDGHLVRDLAELVLRTRALIDAPEARAVMAAAAQERAREFGLPAFDARLQALLDELGPRPLG
jgi:hypothetical protein